MCIGKNFEILVRFAVICENSECAPFFTRSIGHFGGKLKIRLQRHKKTLGKLILAGILVQNTVPHIGRLFIL